MPRPTPRFPPISHAQTTVRLAPSRVVEPVVAFFRLVAPAYLRWVLNFRSVELAGAEAGVEAFRDFQAGKTRLLLAFRHPYGDEPQLMAYTFAVAVPRAARRLGRPLAKPAHAHFVHGYEVPLWMGPAVRWLLPRAGAVPVHHVKLDSDGLRRIRALMLDGPYPLALAPEGQVSYRSECVPRLEQGFARIGFWCAEDLAKAGRGEAVTVLPVSVHYRYGRAAPRCLEKLLKLVEARLGSAPAPGADAYARLAAAAAGLVARAEAFYAELDGAPPAQAVETVALRDAAAAGCAPGELDRRWAAVVGAALAAGERALRLAPEGDVTRRFYRIRQAGWDRIYRGGLAGMSPLERDLADRAAGEAWYAMRHMELADLGFYLDFAELKPADPIERYIETANNYYDLASRLAGGNISDRSNLAAKRAVVAFGRPLELAGRMAAFKADKAGALAAATADLENAYAECVRNYVKEYRHG
jgi:hypothetical protein